eukprot:TRINITY_DN32795_c0_g1_i1.p2 TRINITY_DN32795_c0_g1~~TRINITY_DN32795_c0_g1_i1.p2  ORF type:complete len:393 (+),score=123.32 TRINITY_DN32795_c0_g1_i1:2-1180(+)
MTKEAITLSGAANMRDIFDLCQKHGLPSLAQGMIEFPPPEKLRELAAQEVMNPMVHTYRNRMGEPSYREAISKMVKQVYNEDVPKESVLAVAGVAGGVSAALLALRARKPNAKVALLEPFYTYHVSEVERAFGGCLPPVIPSVGDKAEPGFEELKRRVLAGEVHGVICTNPLNPTGRVITEAEIAGLLELAESHDLFVIMDECYLDMVFNGKTHNSPLKKGIHKNVVACRGFSKCMGCQSWRCGYAISAPETLAEMMKMMDPLFICVNWTQHALGAYFDKHCDDFVRHITELNALIQSNWRILSAAFQKRFGWEPLEPDGTMYGMFRHNEETDIKACEIALQAGVGTCPGTIFFGTPDKPPAKTGWVRIHMGVTKEKAEKICEILENGTPCN